MSQELNHDGSITVIGYSLPEFCFELCELAAKGFIVTMEGSKCPNGGFGSYYSAILVPRHHYRIDLQGNHLNTGETSTETPLNEPTSTVDSAKATAVEQQVKQPTTRSKKTT
jgi:hypothetical protein